MMKVCPVCGKLTVIHWPEHWVWKRGSSYYCGENCISIDITRDIKTLNEVQRRRRSALIMAKLKKDGTPAKKPGPKPKKIEVPEKPKNIETPEVSLADAMTGMQDAADKFFGTCADMGLKTNTEDDAEAKTFTDFGKVIREERYTVTAIRYQEIGEFYYDHKYNAIDWRTAEGEEISMSPTGWKILIRDLPEVMKVLGVER